jgi:FtsZ-binding cell division protein ZapB
MLNKEELQKAVGDFSKYTSGTGKTMHDLAESVLSVEGFPEKRELRRMETDPPETLVREIFGYNSAIGVCLLAHSAIVADKDKEIAELKEEIEQSCEGNEGLKLAVQDLRAERDKLESELSALKSQNVSADDVIVEVDKLIVWNREGVRQQIRKAFKGKTKSQGKMTVEEFCQCKPENRLLCRAMECGLCHSCDLPIKKVDQAIRDRLEGKK